MEAIEEPGRFDILHFACHGLANSASIRDAGLMMRGEMSWLSYVVYADPHATLQRAG
ncbi:hypothetical protein [Desulfogranum mediterraneum]|uniref:hypothetical protein n=1 Tax=Desulfogranum mediterraneum TaxID=160661 RepID=UPI0012947C04|nr:hypothetical protein [Desulfogranum mediterraneum]